jgi:hypothetical protein
MRPRRRPVLLVALALAAAVSTACGASAGPSATAATSPEAAAPSAPETDAPASASASAAAVDLPANGRIELADRGFAVTLPENWLSVDLNDEGIQDALDEGLDEFGAGFDANLRAQVRNAIAGGVAFLAYREPDEAAPAGTNINVIVLPAYGMSLDTLETVNKAQLKQMVGEGGTVNADRVTLPAGEAVLLTYQLEPSGQDPVAFEQYFVLGNDKQVILTCTVLAGGTIGDECRSIADTIEVLE